MCDCNKCIWSDQCSVEDKENSNSCVDYSPYDYNEIAIAEYEADLKERTEYYQELVDEQNS